MLNCTGDTDCKVYMRTNGLTGLSNLQVFGLPASIYNCTGAAYGLVGPNGAGKTTVFNMLTGVYQPTTGTFYLNGEELRGKSQEQINGYPHL